MDAMYRSQLVDSVMERLEDMRVLAEEMAQMSGDQIDRMWCEKVRAAVHEVTAATYAWSLQDADRH